jgi:PIN domain nuclease of toxin-antitoxin system
VKLLLDTHVFLWWREASERIGSEARSAIAGADSVYVSAASAWEVSIKVALGKLEIPGPLGPAVIESRFEPLPITFEHASTVTALPLHHGDPFDRMLAAQARAEGLTLVTHDRRFAPYGVATIWV